MNNSKSAKNPEIVLITSKGGKAELERTGSSLSINPAVRLLIYPDEADSDLGKILEAQRLLFPGELLIRSPYSYHRYSLAGTANETFLREKHFITSLVAGLIGARLVSIQQIEIIEKGQARAITLEGRYHNIGGTIKVEDKEIDKILSDMHLIDEYDESPKRIDEAWKIITESGLVNDDNITTMVKAAELGLQRNRRQVLLTATHDAQQSFSIAASLAVPAAAKINVGYQTSMSNRREYRLLLNIDFRPPGK